MRFATIDIGTNTAQLLVVEAAGDTLRRLHAAERFVRLGEGVDASGKIGEAAQGRLHAALREHKQAAREHGAEQIVAAGTSALRDAANRDAVLERVQQEVEFSVEILSGATEAAWSFAAACSACDDLTGPCLVVDVGGGSTELVAGTDPGAHRPNYSAAIVDRASLDVGCVRLTERCFDAQPPSSDAVEAVTQLIDEALDAASLEVGPDPTVIGTAGTATALALVHLGPDSSWDALHGSGFTLSHSDVQHWRDRLLSLPVDDILDLHPEAMAGRADVFTVGVLLLDRVLSHYDQDSVRVSPYELRHGLALRAQSPSSSSSLRSPS
jgi:exopolyphosphatase/guanosine-5'-triphosphate,3'-diphosphate pyrophosphatase